MTITSLSRRRLGCVLGAVLLSACGSPSGVSASPSVPSTASLPTTPQIQLVDGLVINTASDTGGMSAGVSGTVTLGSDGCWRLSSPGALTGDPIVWPKGTHWSGTQHLSLILPSGALVSSGSRLKGSGGVVSRVVRQSLSIAANVPCLVGTKVTYVAVNADVTKDGS